MAQQTALMELLNWVRATLPMELDTPRMIEEKIESLLDREKEQMLSLIRFMRINDKMGKSVEHLYSEFIKTYGK